MTKLSHARLPPSDLPTRVLRNDAPLDYHAALQEILKESGMTLQQLDTVLDRVGALRGDSQDHLRFDEIQELESLPKDRLAHLENCAYCHGLVDCCCDQEYVQQLARAAMRSSLAKPSRRIRHFGSKMAIGAATLALLLAFPIGKLYSSSEVKKVRQDIYRKQLSNLRMLDTGEEFKAARLYAELNLPGQTRLLFFKALRGESVPEEQIVKLRNLTLEAEQAGWLERTTAKAEVALKDHLFSPAPKSAEDYLRIADLQLTAGKSTAGYTSILKYLDSMDANLTASKEFTEPPVAMRESTSGQSNPILQ